jgi:hypothetical protein
VFDPLTLLWTVTGVGVVAFVAIRAWSWRRGPRESSFGSISERWLSEHRANRPDSER